MSPNCERWHSSKIKTIFFVSTLPSALLLIIGGLFLIKNYSKRTHKYDCLIHEIPFKIMFFIGLFQTISIFPGVSRSGATIIGSLILGLSIQTAIEVSFFLALPTILSASLYEIIFGKVHIQNYEIKVFDILLNPNGILIVATGFVFSFIFSMIFVPKILQFTQKNGFRLFGYYRIIIGLFIVAIFVFQKLYG
jgi:undecaprenyl-diphosphatase